MKTKTNNQNGLTLSMALLALVCLSGQASAAITTGVADGPATCDANTKICTSNTPLKVGPAPGGGGAPVNPADYGMCGLLHMSGTFNASTSVRVVVESDGYYGVERTWSETNPAGAPKVVWTCVLFTDFTGLAYEYVNVLSTSAETLTAKSGGKATNMVGPSDACIWAGLAGALSSSDRTEVSVSAQFDGNYTFQSAQPAPKSTLETYSFCSSIEGWAFAPFLNNVVVPGLGDTGGMAFKVAFPAVGTPGILSKRWWCYMDGAGAKPGTGTSAKESFTSAGLKFVSPEEYYFSVGKESALWFNCMGLDQAPLTY